MSLHSINSFIDFVRQWYNTDEFIPLHEPRFLGNEKEYLTETINSTFVSSIGEFVNQFEQKIANYTGAKHAIAVSNGTSALHASLILSGVKPKDEIITQSLTFIGTVNAIKYCSATPIFIDVDQITLGMSAKSLKDFFENNCHVINGNCINRTSGKRISACVPAYIFGEPLEIQQIIKTCNEYNVSVIEDAAEALGSFVDNKHCGTFGKFGILSFNGNKVITTGGGGMILTNDSLLAKEAKHLTTTAKLTHSWHYRHDKIGFNYRMPNLNAALGCAQLEQLDEFLMDKHKLASAYESWCQENGLNYINGRANGKPNFWLNALLFPDIDSRDEFLQLTNDSGVMTRPTWTPMHKLPIYSACQSACLKNTEHLANTVVNVPSSARLLK